jgi:hypothetical protein
MELPVVGQCVAKNTVELAKVDGTIGRGGDHRRLRVCGSGYRQPTTACMVSFGGKRAEGNEAIDF